MLTTTQEWKKKSVCLPTVSSTLVEQARAAQSPYPPSSRHRHQKNADGCTGAKHNQESGWGVVDIYCSNPCVELTGSMTWHLIWGSQKTELQLWGKALLGRKLQERPVTKTARRAAFDNFCVFRRSSPCEEPANLVNVHEQRYSTEHRQIERMIDDKRRKFIPANEAGSRKSKNAAGCLASCF